MKTTALLSLFLCINIAAAQTPVQHPYDCIEIKLFDVDRNDFSSNAMTRATEIPEEILHDVQHVIVAEMSRDADNGLRAVKSDDPENTCDADSSTLVLSGKITDYKKGNRAVRYLVGLGFGKQKIQVQAELHDKATGRLLKNDRVVDRKFGGLAGGSAHKGKRDFAEKINNFVRTALGLKKGKL